MDVFPIHPGIPATLLQGSMKRLNKLLRRFLMKKLPMLYNRDNPPKNQGASVWKAWMTHESPSLPLKLQTYAWLPPK
jgi:hypothetical protein